MAPLHRIRAAPQTITLPPSYARKRPCQSTYCSDVLSVREMESGERGTTAAGWNHHPAYHWRNGALAEAAQVAIAVDWVARAHAPG
eukprot:7069262-Prymnesium_polylepis.1